MSNAQILSITIVGVIGLFLIVVWPNLPASTPYVDPCTKIGAKFIYQNLCVKPDGSVWQLPVPSSP